jgi:hypothetical protein
MAATQAWRRLNKHWRPRLRQNGALVALFALLMLGLLEPLACILHCTLWMPLHVQAGTSQQQAHQHHQHHQQADTTKGAVAAVVAEAPASWMGQTAPVTNTHCVVGTDNGHGTNGHHAPLAEASHEMALVLLVLAPVILLVQHYGALPPRSSPLRFLTPLLRPPIA